MKHVNLKYNLEDDTKTIYPHSTSCFIMYDSDYPNLAFSSEKIETYDTYAGLAINDYNYNVTFREINSLDISGGIKGSSCNGNFLCLLVCPEIRVV
ncbi:hypothetical protein [Paenibacillus pinihumi]|uniref:hypothetical protein n=1 Tax=Paenibacillus pinihumi TaxID=669462 RepID=UPI0012B674D5|nr:hypothetical protein [Paenibacillus pinihumi]